MKKEILNAELGQLRNLANYIERNDLLPKFYILMLCLIFALPNVLAVRVTYYVIVLPMFFITAAKSDLQNIVRSPIFLISTTYFALVSVVIPFAPEFSWKIFVEHIRNSLLVLSFLAITAHLTRRNPHFADRLILFLAATAAVVAANNIWQYYGAMFHFDPRRWRLQGIPGLTMYYNPNWIAQMYGVCGVGAVAAATRPGTSRAAVPMLIVSASILFAAVALTQSRSVLLGVMAALLVVIVLLPRQFPLRRAIQLGGMAVGILAGVAVIESSMSRGDSYRLFIWKAYFDYALAHSWVGSGLSSRLLVTAPDGFETTHPHNIVYHALLRGGVFAAVALVALLLSNIFYAARDWQKTGSALLPALITAAFLPLQLEFTVVFGTSVGWDWLVLWMPIGLCIGASMNRYKNAAESSGA